MSQYIVNQPQGMLPEMPMPMQQQQPIYEPKDVIEQYGSVVKEIFETEMLIAKFHASLLGKKVNPDTGAFEEDNEAEVYIKDERAAREFIQMVKSKVNKHVDFSFFTEDEANQRIVGSIKEINRWLLLQGECVPTRYRAKIAGEAMAMIDASYHKATNGRMLQWTRSTINLQEGYNIGANEGGARQGWLASAFSALNPFKRR